MGALTKADLQGLCKKHKVQMRRSIDDTVAALKEVGVKMKDIREAAKSEAENAKKGTKKINLKDKKSKDKGSYVQRTKAYFSEKYEKGKEKVCAAVDTTKEHMNKASVVSHVDAIRDYSGFVVKYGSGLGLAAVAGMSLGFGMVGTLAVFGALYLISAAISAVMSRRKVDGKYEVGFFRTIWNSIVAELKALASFLNRFKKATATVGATA